MPVKNGDKVKVEYKGILNDGTVFDSSDKCGEPLEFEVGAGRIISGFENAILGMEKGEEKEFELQPKDAYGDYNPQLIQKVPRDKIPLKVVPGMMLEITLPDGQQMPVKVSEVTDEWISIDMNHPLAGKVLIFKIKILDIAS
ncbi:MAG: peptidylprolyl isomerase [Methanomassiliicoccales archaeon]|nr:MAG: peptidylprolyl isomerase [Methanomassiliicoccales archaeon]